MNQVQQPHSVNIIALLFALIIGGSIVVVLVAAIAGQQLGDVVSAIAVFGVIVVAVLIVVSIIVRFAADPIVKIGNIRLEHQREANRHDEKYLAAGYVRDDSIYKPIMPQIIAPAARSESAPEPIDPRHALLVSLTLLTIRTKRQGDNEYGPTSKRLMTADDAQAISGAFADRNNWDLASKYGQEIGYLMVQRGGKVSEQGLKIKGAGNNTAADLIEALVNRNLILDSGVNALPGVER